MLSSVFFPSLATAGGTATVTTAKEAYKEQLKDAIAHCENNHMRAARKLANVLNKFKPVNKVSIANQ